MTDSKDNIDVEGLRQKTKDKIKAEHDIVEDAEASVKDLISDYKHTDYCEACVNMAITQTLGVVREKLEKQKHQIEKKYSSNGMFLLKQSPTAYRLEGRLELIKELLVLFGEDKKQDKSKEEEGRKT